MREKNNNGSILLHSEWNIAQPMDTLTCREVHAYCGLVIVESIPSSNGTFTIWCLYTLVYDNNPVWYSTIPTSMWFKLAMCNELCGRGCEGHMMAEGNGVGETS